MRKIVINILPEFEDDWHCLEFSMQHNRHSPTIHKSVGLAVRFLVNESTVMRLKMQKLETENQQLKKALQEIPTMPKRFKFFRFLKF